MHEGIAQHTIKSGGAFVPPGDLVTVEDADEFRSLVERGALVPADGGEQVDPGGNLPDDLPARKEMLAAGFASLDEVADAVEAGTLTDVDGIGAATVEKVVAYLEEHFWEADDE